MTMKGKQYIATTGLVLSSPGEYDRAIPKDCYFTVLEEPAEQDDLQVEFNGQPGVIKDVFDRGKTAFLTQMESVSHLKKGKMYRLRTRVSLHKEPYGCTWESKSFGSAPKDSVVMFLQHSPIIAYTFMIIAGDQAGWVNVMPEYFKELVDEEG